MIQGKDTWDFTFTIHRIAQAGDAPLYEVNSPTIPGARFTDADVATALYQLSNMCAQQVKSKVSTSDNILAAPGTGNAGIGGGVGKASSDLPTSRSGTWQGDLKGPGT